MTTLYLRKTSLDGIRRPNETPMTTVRRLLAAERKRIARRNYRPTRTPRRDVLTEAQAGRVDALRRTYKQRVGCWPELN